MPERGSFRLFEKLHAFTSESLSKTCIHKENELKTHPMKPRQYIYRKFRSY